MAREAEIVVGRPDDATLGVSACRRSSWKSVSSWGELPVGLTERLEVVERRVARLEGHFTHTGACLFVTIPLDFLIGRSGHRRPQAGGYSRHGMRV